MYIAVILYCLEKNSKKTYLFIFKEKIIDSGSRRLIIYIQYTVKLSGELFHNSEQKPYSLNNNPLPIFWVTDNLYSVSKKLPILATSYK